MENILVRQLNEHLYQLSENISPQSAVEMYLVEGEKKAALIDTGFGLSGDLAEAVRKITDKPVVCLITHCDPDHAGGAALFDDIHMSVKDQPLMDDGALAPRVRLATVQTVADEQRFHYFEEHIVKAQTFNYTDIKNGEIFDLGGRELIAVSLAGHTNGSMCFWNKEEGYCLCGDAIINVDAPVLFLKRCLPLEDYKANLINFMALVGKECQLYTGHDTDVVSIDTIREIVILCNEVLSRKTENDISYKPPFIRDVPENAKLKEKLKARLLGRAVTKRELGDSVPMEHKGKSISIRYNAKKIHHGDK